MKDRVVIHLDNVEGCIASYEHMLFHEPGNCEIGVAPLTPFQYLSVLFNNLGYDRCPSDFLWMERGLNVEDVTKSEVLDYPITFNCIMLKGDCTLFDLMMVVRNWVRGGVERGRLLDPNKSFRLPSLNEIQYNLQNRIRIQRSAFVRPKIDVWDKADIMWRRLFNLVPSKDPEYFEFSLSQFEKWSRCVRVIDPFSAFAAAIVDPDLLFSAIEQAEKEAVHTIWNASDKRVPLPLLNEEPMAQEFANTLHKQLSHLSNIYRNRGASGFVRPKYFVQKKLVAVGQPTVGTQVQLHRPFVYGQEPTQGDQYLLSAIFQQIAAAPLDGEHKGFVMSYIEPNSLRFIDAMGEDSMVRIATYKRLYYTLEQLKKSNPELLNPKDRFVMSESFYIDPDRFGLYSKSRNRFYIAGLDLVVREMTPQEALEYYGVYLGKNVLLDPNELGDTFESEPVDDIDLAELERQNLGIPQPQPTVPIQTVPVQPMRQQQPELYGFNPTLVAS